MSASAHLYRRRRGRTTSSGSRQDVVGGSVNLSSRDEATAFLITLDSMPPTAATACSEWTVHDLVAHLAAGAAEMAELTERVLAGQEVRPTRGFAEREGPYAALADEELRRRLVVEALRLNAAVEALSEAGMAVPFSGRILAAAEMGVHGRSEAALHRWDLAGDDDIGDELLGRSELTSHAVSVLNSMLEASAESPVVRAQAAGLDGIKFSRPDVRPACSAVVEEGFVQPDQRPLTPALGSLHRLS